jgi:hypothetical protein
MYGLKPVPFKAKTSSVISEARTFKARIFSAAFEVSFLQSKEISAC